MQKNNAFILIELLLAVMVLSLGMVVLANATATTAMGVSRANDFFAMRMVLDENIFYRMAEAEGGFVREGRSASSLVSYHEEEVILPRIIAGDDNHAQYAIVSVRPQKDRVIVHPFNLIRATIEGRPHE